MFNSLFLVFEVQFYKIPIDISTIKYTPIDTVIDNPKEMMWYFDIYTNLFYVNHTYWNPFSPIIRTPSQKNENSELGEHPPEGNWAMGNLNPPSPRNMNCRTWLASFSSMDLPINAFAIQCLMPYWQISNSHWTVLYREKDW